MYMHMVKHFCPEHPRFFVPTQIIDLCDRYRDYFIGNACSLSPTHANIIAYILVWRLPYEIIDGLRGCLHTRKRDLFISLVKMATWALFPGMGACLGHYTVA